MAFTSFYCTYCSMVGDITGSDLSPILFINYQFNILSQKTYISAFFSDLKCLDICKNGELHFQYCYYALFGSVISLLLKTEKNNEIQPKWYTVVFIKYRKIDGKLQQVVKSFLIQVSMLEMTVAVGFKVSITVPNLKLRPEHK